MRVAALVSGGKDSIYAVYIALQYGWDVTHLVTLVPSNMDSWMFHGVNLHLMSMVAENMGISLVEKHTDGEKEKELKDLKEALSGLPVEGVVSGAVASDYQRSRINHVCDGLGLKSFTPLWHKNPEQLLRWQMQAGFSFIIVAVSAEGFDAGWLGKEIGEKNIDEFIEHCKKHRIHVAGEGGEFETFVTKSPLYGREIRVVDAEVVWERDQGHLLIKKVV